MIERFFLLFERLVTAFERQATATEGYLAVMGGGGATQAAPAAPAVQPEAPLADERDTLKAELTKLGVEFSPRAATTTLKRLLSEHTEAPAFPADPPAAPPVEAPAAAPAAAPGKKYTVEEVRSQLKVYVARHGREAALEILNRIGVKNVSEIPTDKYAEIMEQCK